MLKARGHPGLLMSSLPMPSCSLGAAMPTFLGFFRETTGRQQNHLGAKKVLGPSANIRVAQKWLAAMGPRGLPTPADFRLGVKRGPPDVDRVEIEAQVEARRQVQREEAAKSSSAAAKRPVGRPLRPRPDVT